MSENGRVGSVVPSASEGAASLKPSIGECHGNNSGVLSAFDVLVSWMPSIGESGLAVGSSIISSPEVPPTFSLIDGEYGGEGTGACSQTPLVGLLRFALLLTRQSAIINS
ncbi:hypothetical protein TorRG33x02_067520, partial [Trema orientale]